MNILLGVMWYFLIGLVVATFPEWVKFVSDAIDEQKKFQVKHWIIISLVGWPLLVTAIMIAIVSSFIETVIELVVSWWCSR